MQYFVTVGVPMVRGVILPSPNDLRYHPYNTGHTTVWLCHSLSKNGVTLKTGLGFVQGHWKCHHLIDHIRVPIIVA